MLKSHHLSGDPLLAHYGKPNFQTSTRPRAHTGENQNPESKLLEEQPREWLDTGATPETGGTNQAVETVGAVNGAEDCGR